MAKALGTEILDFYINGWPDGYHHDDNELGVDEENKSIIVQDTEEVLPSTDRYDLDRFGSIIADDYANTFPFAHFFNKWKKEQTTATVVITFPKEKYNDTVAMLKGLGYKVA